MRTLASTFSTRDEAEAATRRLEAIGIQRERIVMKDVAPAGAAAAGVFLSVKVTTEQVQPVSDILKSHAAPESAVAAPPDRPVDEVASIDLREPDLPRGPAMGVAELAPAPGAGAVQTPTGARSVRPRDERAQLGRTLVYFGLALVAAFMLGAWLGMLG